MLVNHILGVENNVRTRLSIKDEKREVFWAMKGVDSWFNDVNAILLWTD